MVSTWNSSLTKNLYGCHLFSLFPFFNGQPSMVSAVLFVSKDHTAVLLCDPILTEELKDKTLKYIVHRIADLMWSFYLITLFRPLDHLHTVGCIFEILTNTNTERQRQIQKGKDKHRKQRQVQKANTNTEWQRQIHNYNSAKSTKRTWTGRLLVSLTLTLRACQS